MFWLTHDNGIEIARSCQSHRSEKKCIETAKKIAAAFRQGDVKLVGSEGIAADVNQYGD